MGIVAFVNKCHHSHYEELKLQYHVAIAFVNPSLLKKKLRKTVAYRSLFFNKAIPNCTHPTLKLLLPYKS